MRALYDRASAEALDLGRKDLQIKNLKQETDAVQRRLDETNTRLEQLNVESSISGRISVLSYGDKAQPYKNKRTQLTAAGGLGGAMLGIGLIALWGFMDRRVKSLRAMRDQIGNNIQMLGVLPMLPDDLSDPAQASMAAYCVHHIRTLLEIGPGRAGGRVMAVTSPEARDGKTSLSLALGMSFAASNSKTLLIDCDIVGGGLTARLNAIIRRRIGQILRQRGLLTEPQLAEALSQAQITGHRIGEVLVELGYVVPDDLQEALSAQKESMVGLLEVLDGEPLAQCIANAGTPGLFILPLGSAAAHHAGQISPRALRRFLADARQHFDVVLADTGPILGSLEASIVAAEADEVILTVSRGQQRQLVDRAIHHLRFINSRVAGLVFNRASAKDVLTAGYSSSAASQSMRINHEGAVMTNGTAKSAATARRLGPIASAVASSTVPADEAIPS